jgi:hypothetical protein
MKYCMGSPVAAKTEFAVDDIYSIIERTFRASGYNVG